MLLFFFILISIIVLIILIGKFLFFNRKYRNNFLIKAPFFVVGIFLMGILLLILTTTFSLWNLSGSINPCGQCEEKKMICKIKNFNSEMVFCDFKNTKNCACCECFEKLDCIDCFFFWDGVAHCDTNFEKCYPGW